MVTDGCVILSKIAQGFIEKKGFLGNFLDFSGKHKYFCKNGVTFLPSDLPFSIEYWKQYAN